MEPREISVTTGVWVPRGHKGLKERLAVWVDKVSKVTWVIVDFKEIRV